MDRIYKEIDEKAKELSDLVRTAYAARELVKGENHNGVALCLVVSMPNEDGVDCTSSAFGELHIIGQILNSYIQKEGLGETLMLAFLSKFRNENTDPNDMDTINKVSS